MSKSVEVQGFEINYKRIIGEDYISLTDLAKFANPTDPSGVIRNWMSNKDSFAFYSLWEVVNNLNFNSVEMRRIKINEVGYNRFTMTPKRWKQDFNAIGISPGAGKYSAGTFAHKDIAFEFASWLNPEFKLYLIVEFQRLKEEEQKQIGWTAKRELAKINYRIHTDAIKENLIPTELSPAQINIVYASEADVLNVALFGMTAAEWRKHNSDKQGNIRDYATINELICLSNMENINAVLIEDGIPQAERLQKLNKIAISQMNVLNETSGRKLLK